ncbi:acyltransferase Pun1-like [Nicotiana tabacum]|uniref:Acyltransferase Pun1-like n=1 Tax=Nicotiana tabacum TaxID=4097 RepID=A0AC58STR0_TOBAC
MKSYEPNQVNQRPENSLSKALSSYYPYAGRITRNGSFVNCNDMGVEFICVRVRCPMSDILEHPYTYAENVVFPQRKPWIHKDEGNVAMAQVSYFDCGGIAVGGCLSHKIGDGCTSSNFFYDWALLSRDISATPAPHFVGASVYPQSTDPSAVATLKSDEPTYLGKRFGFPRG